MTKHCCSPFATWLILSAISVIGSMELPANVPANDRPNILWITCEDISPNLGCYGDAYAITLNIDRLAMQGVRYTHAFAPIGVCAPSRSCLITGMYACSLGTQHMRCKGNLPDIVRCFPHYLQEAGYYCTNNSKTDYNFDAPAGSWNESSNKAHWRKRASGQPFFSVFNFTSCHEGQIRLNENQYLQRTADFTDAERHDPARAPMPPYHPDTPEVRQDWARYADMITVMDKQVEGVLAELETDGLSGDTIVFFFSDHGAGMPRSKRWLYDSSTHVPLIVRFPEKYRRHASGEAGSTSDRLVSFVDFGPTVLSLAGVPVPAHMQGIPFLGEQAGRAREYVHGYRDRMDERYDMVRMTRDKRYKYLRNYMPHLPYFHHQHIHYMYEMPTMRVWQSLADQGKLRGPAAVFMAMSKPTEELYDTQNDPWEVKNLAESREHSEILARLRGECRRWQEEIYDLGLMPEADLRTRFGPEPPYVAVRRDAEIYPFKRIAAAADLANEQNPAHAERLVGLLADSDPAVRYWAATGLGTLGPKASVAGAALEASLEDSARSVRVAAADALCRIGAFEKAVPALGECLHDSQEWVRLQTINVLDRIDREALPLADSIHGKLQDENDYVKRVAEHAMSAFHKGATPSRDCAGQQSTDAGKR